MEDAVDEHLDVDEAVPDVHGPGHVDGGGKAARVQAKVEDGAVGGAELLNLLRRQISCIIIIIIIIIIIVTVVFMVSIITTLVLIILLIVVTIVSIIIIIVIIITVVGNVMVRIIIMNLITSVLLDTLVERLFEPVGVFQFDVEISLSPPALQLGRFSATNCNP